MPNINIWWRIINQIWNHVKQHLPQTKCCLVNSRRCACLASFKNLKPLLNNSLLVKNPVKKVIIYLKKIFRLSFFENFQKNSKNFLKKIQKFFFSILINNFRWMSQFIREIRKDSGEAYQIDSITAFAFSLQKVLKETGRQVDILRNEKFVVFLEVLYQSNSRDAEEFLDFYRLNLPVF